MRTLRQVKMQYIRWALKRFDGNRTYTAKAIGLSIRSLRNYINSEPEFAAERKRVGK